MNHNMKSTLKDIGKFFLVFAFSYALLLPFWLKAEGVYNSILVESVINIFNWYFDFKFDSLNHTVSKFDYLLSTEALYENINFQWNLKFRVDLITYNIPMTLSAVIALLALKVKEKKEYFLLLHVIFLLVLLHTVTVYALALGGLVGVANMSELMRTYLQEHTMLLSQYNSVITFLVQYGIRFEPFLMMIYIWIMLEKKK